MRKDIAETLREFLMNGIKPNYSKTVSVKQVATFFDSFLRKNFKY